MATMTDELVSEIEKSMLEDPDNWHTVYSEKEKENGNHLVHAVQRRVLESRKCDIVRAFLTGKIILCEYVGSRKIHTEIPIDTSWWKLRRLRKATKDLLTEKALRTFHRIEMKLASDG